MGFAEVLLIAVGMAMDAFAVSLGIGTSRRANSPRPIFRLSFHFGLFQFFMPILGWLAGSSIANLIGAFDHWVALALLAFVGGRMIRSGLGADGAPSSNDPAQIGRNIRQADGGVGRPDPDRHRAACVDQSLDGVKIDLTPCPFPKKGRGVSPLSF
jgi:putative Mn2+ efflux pump MntP